MKEEKRNEDKREKAEWAFYKCNVDYPSLITYEQMEQWEDWKLYDWIEARGYIWKDSQWEYKP